MLEYVHDSLGITYTWHFLCDKNAYVVTNREGNTFLLKQMWANPESDKMKTEAIGWCFAHGDLELIKLGLSRALELNGVIPSLSLSNRLFYHTIALNSVHLGLGLEESLWGRLISNGKFCNESGLLLLEHVPFKQTWSASSFYPYNLEAFKFLLERRPELQCEEAYQHGYNMGYSQPGGALAFWCMERLANPDYVGFLNKGIDNNDQKVIEGCMAKGATISDSTAATALFTLGRPKKMQSLGYAYTSSMYEFVLSSWVYSYGNLGHCKESIAVARPLKWLFDHGVAPSTSEIAYLITYKTERSDDEARMYRDYVSMLLYLWPQVRLSAAIRNAIVDKSKKVHAWAEVIAPYKHLPVSEDS